MNHGLSKIAILGNYLPRRCGIATFTTDICDALAAQAPEVSLFAIAMNDTREGYRYPDRVRFQVSQNRLVEYRNAAEFLNITNPEVVCVQHEYGIFGGPAGGMLLSLMRELRMPVVTTLHTVLKDPDMNQRHVMEEVARLSDRLVVMSARAGEFLSGVYGVPPDKVRLIPHGVADVPFVDPNYHKDLFGVEGRKVMLTFGLMSPDKGIEYAIRALPAIAAKHPDVVYMVVGATHPHVVRQNGEEYRFSLQQLARQMDVEKSVIFHDRFVEAEELHAFLGSADVVVTPYLKERQIVSGALSLAVGSGKAIVSTPYWYATEVLADGRGVIVPFRDSRAIAEAVTRLLDDEVERTAMRKRAYLFGREMVWKAVAARYLDLFDEALAGYHREPRMARQAAARAEGLMVEEAPALRFSHLKRMTDSTGVIQHAKYTVPDRAHGYCTDDNARALVAAVHAARLLGDEAEGTAELAATYLSFLDHALVGETGRFCNFMRYDRRWADGPGSEDSHGRALWGLGTAAALGMEEGLVAVATRLFNEALAPTTAFTSPRAVALALMGIHEYLRRFSGDVGAHRVREALAEWLYGRFDQYGRDHDWPWPEDTLTYINARLPQALLLAGQWMNRPDMAEAALRSLEFLLRVQTSAEGHFEPVGYKGWYPRHGVKARFDQQPVEAEATLEACVGAWRLTREQVWLDRAQMCYDWFLGRNDLGAALYDHVSGGCKDGLQADGVNQNEGAESTLAWLLAALTMEEVKAEFNVRKKETGAAAAAKPPRQSAGMA